MIDHIARGIIRERGAEEFSRLRDENQSYKNWQARQRQNSTTSSTQSPAPEELERQLGLSSEEEPAEPRFNRRNFQPSGDVIIPSTREDNDNTSGFTQVETDDEISSEDRRSPELGNPSDCNARDNSPELKRLWAEIVERQRRFTRDLQQ